MGCDHKNTFKGVELIYFNPRTHRGVRPPRTSSPTSCYRISIHAPIVGCDFLSSYSPANPSKFQSTHPSWGATFIISTCQIPSLYFNPRTHRGVRPLSHFFIDSLSYFNPRTHRGVRQKRVKGLIT